MAENTSTKAMDPNGAKIKVTYPDGLSCNVLLKTTDIEKITETGESELLRKMYVTLSGKDAWPPGEILMEFQEQGSYDTLLKKGQKTSGKNPVDRFAGPLKDFVPYRYHGYLGEDLLNSYVVRNHVDGRKCEEEGLIPPGCNLIVTSQPNYEEVYPQICENLTEIGKDAIKDIKPWIINCLIDFGNFDQVICTCPIRDDAVASESSELDTSCQGASVKIGTASNYVWTDKDTKYFLQLIEQHYERMVNPRVKKTAIWVDIASEMIEQGFLLTPKQCETKWKNLKRSFHDGEKHNKQSGNSRKDITFYDDLSRILGGKPTVRPVCLLESSGTTTCGSGNETATDGQATSDTTPSKDVKGKQLKKKKTPKKSKVTTTQLLDYMKEMRTEEKEMMERQHEERMDLFKTFIDVLKEKK